MTDRILPYLIIEELWHTYEDFEDFARAIEQDVLHSEQVQALRKDADRYRWLRDNSSVILDRPAWFKAESGTHIDTTMPSQRELDAAIDAAMEQQA